MKNLDQWILVVIACMAVISPCITTYLNNRYQYKIAKFNTQYSTKIKYVNDYFEHLSTIIARPSSLDALRDYLSSAQKLYIVVDDDCRRYIDNITYTVSKERPSNFSEDFLNSLEDDMCRLSKNIAKCIE